MNYTQLTQAIHDMTLRIQAGQMATDRIEDRHKKREFLRAPFLKSDHDKLRARRRAYDCVKRVKQERALTARLVGQRAALIARRDEILAAARATALEL